jgi:peptidoglycan-associated lipoprotein
MEARNNRSHKEETDMQSKVLTHTMILALVAALSLVGCKKKPFQPTGPAGGSSATGSGATPSPITGTDIGAGAGVKIDGPGMRPDVTSADLEKHEFPTVYFDYDSAKIKPAEMSKLKTIADKLKGTSKKVLIEGHCDERGTAEYNRALGERRAQAALAELKRMGIDASHLSTISFGKDRPVEPAHDDTAWSRNRRCEFVTTEK